VPKTSRERIISAAIEVFSEKGKHGSRMEEIAARAGVNRAMVYYYFSDRENLYRTVLLTIFKTLFSIVGGRFDYALNEISDPVERIKYISRLYSRTIFEHQQYVRVLLEALTGGSDDIPGIIREVRQKNIPFDQEKLAAMLKDGIMKKTFRQIAFSHFINAFMGLQMSFFVIRPVFTTIIGMSEEEQQEFLREREEVIPDILLNGILERSEQQ